jgi:hypothetical protein
MGRNREYDKDKQSDFAKKHREVPGVYMTDLDGIIWTTNNTENQVYVEYGFIGDKKSEARKIVEVKHGLTGYLSKMMTGQIPPNAQLIALVDLTADVNRGREVANKELLQFWYIIQTEGDLPYDVYKVNTDYSFEFIATVTSQADFDSLFKPSP